MSFGVIGSTSGFGPGDWGSNPRGTTKIKIMKNNKEKIDKLPDPKLHQQISFVKSGIRILGYVFIPFSLGWAVIFLILSEVIGIIEELV